MNIFFTDMDPRVAARDLCDAHIRKQGIEAVQMLCTTLHVRRFYTAEQALGQVKASVLRRRVESAKMEADARGQWTPFDYIYRPAYINHPCTVWTRQSNPNFEWLMDHADEIFNQWRLRFKATDMNVRHESSFMLDKIRKLWYTIGEPKLAGHKLTPPAQAIPITDWYVIYPNTTPNHARQTFEFAIQTYQRYVNMCKKHLHRWTPPATQPTYVNSNSI